MTPDHSVIGSTELERPLGRLDGRLPGHGAAVSSPVLKAAPLQANAIDVLAVATSAHYLPEHSIQPPLASILVLRSNVCVFPTPLPGRSH